MPAEEMRRILRRDEAVLTGRRLGEAIGRGVRLAPHAAELFAEVAPALIVHRVVVVAGERCDDDFVEHLVDGILLLLLRGRRGKLAPAERGAGTKGTPS
jgi:hypothetical protein